MIEPYYSDNLTTIYHGDALEILPSIRAASIGLVVTDPPYVIGAVSAGNMATKAGGWADMMNSALWFEAWYREASRVLHSTGAMWSFANWRSIPVVMRAAFAAGLPVTSMLVWDKEWIGPGGSQGLRPSYEVAALMAHPGFAIPDRGTPDIRRHQVGSHKPHGHPAEKPEGLMRWIIETSAVDGAVLDPFTGSGSTLAAARSLELPAIGIEAEERWCEVAARRCSQQTLDFGGVA